VKLPRDCSGRDLIKVLCRDWGYRQVHQVGSHVILETDLPTHQRVAVPDHSVLHLVAEHERVKREALLRSL
jgi:predicted RNA binding protein YcfA (HicA-like mRNA interferase family)